MSDIPIGQAVCWHEWHLNHQIYSLDLDLPIDGWRCSRVQTSEGLSLDTWWMNNGRDVNHKLIRDLDGMLGLGGKNPKVEMPVDYTLIFNLILEKWRL